MGEYLILIALASPFILVTYLELFPPAWLIEQRKIAKRNRDKSNKAWATRNSKRNGWYLDKNLFK